MKKALMLSTFGAFFGGMLAVGSASASSFGLGCSDSLNSLNSLDCLFFDNFDRKAKKGVVGNSWTELESNKKGVSIKKNKLVMRGGDGLQQDPGAAISRGIESGDHNFFTVTFDWTTSKKVDDNDFLYFSYAFGNGLDSESSMANGFWEDESVMRLANEGKGTFSDSFTIEKTGNETDQLYIMVWTSADEKKEKISVDNLLVTGSSIEPVNQFSSDRVSPALFTGLIPEVVDDIPDNPLPASLPLMAAGLGAFTYMRRRKTKS